MPNINITMEQLLLLGFQAYQNSRVAAGKQPLVTPIQPELRQLSMKGRPQKDTTLPRQSPLAGPSCSSSSSSAVKKPRPKTKAFQSKKEERVRELLEKITGFPWPKVRPEWLRLPDSETGKGRKLELDMFCAELGDKGLACEYDGHPHAEFIPHIHRTFANFKLSQERDRWKTEQCAKQGVPLIRISFIEWGQIDPDDEEAQTQFLRDKLSEAYRMNSSPQSNSQHAASTSNSNQQLQSGGR